MPLSPDDTLSRPQRRAFRVARKAAVGVLKSRFRTLALVQQAYAKLFKDSGGMARVRGDAGLLIRLVRAWGRRDYRALPWRSLLYATAALVYFVAPLDLIPDFLAGVGLVDDVAVVAAVVGALRSDLVAFETWEAARSAKSTPLP